MPVALPAVSPDLEGAGVLLTAWRQEDLAAIVELADDPASRAWSASLRHVYDVDGARAWLAGRAGPDRVDWAVREPGTGRLIGRTGLHRFDGDRPPSAELGYGVHPAYRRRGLAVAAAQTATRYGFEQLGLLRIELVHASGNIASCAVATRAGFAYEGTDRASMDHGDGVLHDAHRHARLATDQPGPAEAVPLPLDVPDLAGAGVRLRPWTDAEAEIFARGMADPLSARWSNAPQPFTAAHALRMFDHFRRRAREGQSVVWAAESDGVVAGSLGVRSINTVDKHASVAYWVLPEHRGRGIAPAALRLATDYAFDALGLHRVQLQHAVENTASCRVAEKAGFGLESVQRGSCLLAEGFVDEHQHVRLSTDD